MIIKFTFFALAAIILLVSFKWMRRRFDSFELFLIFMFASSACQQFFYAVSSSYQIRVVEGHLPFWIARIQFGINFPILLMWVLYFFRTEKRFSAKLSVCFCWVTFGVYFEKIMLMLGILNEKREQWLPYVDMILAMIVLTISVGFMEYISNVLKREKLIKSD